MRKQIETGILNRNILSITDVYYFIYVFLFKVLIFTHLRAQPYILFQNEVSIDCSVYEERENEEEANISSAYI